MQLEAPDVLVALVVLVVIEALAAFRVFQLLCRLVFLSSRARGLTYQPVSRGAAPSSHHV